MHERVFEAEWDEEGVYFYQAYNDPIADWAIENQRQETLSEYFKNLRLCCDQVGRTQPPTRVEPDEDDLDQALLRLDAVQIWIREET